MDTNISLTADRLPLVRDMGWNQIANVYTHPDRLLDYDVFLFVTKGSMQVIEEGTEYIVREQEHLFLKKGLHHWGLPKTEPGTSWYWIHFITALDERVSYSEHLPMPELGYFYPHHYEYRFTLAKYGTSPLHQGLAQRLLTLLGDYRQLKMHGMTRSSILVFQLFLDLHEASLTQESPESNGGKAHTIAGRVMSYLAQHSNGEFDSAKLSGELSLNYSYLSASFKKQTGQSIIEAHTKLRMNKAIDIMRNTSLNISEISERLGYKNPYYFSRVFKKVLGEAPTSYLRHYYKP
ncbi:AraC family transcriptional regulator [Paenibacillus sp. Soil522]|nr:AraC family transcriptional regulator [Paenibacillus sp. Soil522]